jgi:carbamoyl-phosphate synthase large subunit
MTPVHVLITAASRRVALVQAFQRAVRARRMPGRVIVTDVNPLSPAVHVADRAYRVPLSTDPAYVPELLTICEAEGIRLVVPTIDDELAAVGEARAAFARAGSMLACSPPATSRLCDDKYATCRWLEAAGVPSARSWRPDELPSDRPMPLFVKPRVGRGGVGAFAVHTRRELAFFLDYVSDPVVQEYLDGPEYTIDVLCDGTGRPLSIVPRERAVIRAGVIDRGRTVRDGRLMDLAGAVCHALRFSGPLNIQCRMRHGAPVVFEINPRFSGGIALTMAAGADLPAMLVGLAAGERVVPALGAFREGLWMTSYESSVFVEASDLDGALVAAATRAEEVA